MNAFNKTLAALALTGAVLAGITTANATSVTESTTKLLTASFTARQVVTIEAGDFHFVPGQNAPVHTHAAPAIGYVAKGEILYQVEGEKPQLLREGAAFYEPAGPRILRFDNASATEEAIFIDFNLQQEGEPFIVFEQALTENIDRRTLPTTNLAERSVEQVDIFVSELEPAGTKQIAAQAPTLGYVAEGVITLSIDNGKVRRVVAGESFSLPANDAQTTIVNVSSEVPAKVITFRLL